MRLFHIFAKMFLLQDTGCISLEAITPASHVKGMLCLSIYTQSILLGNWYYAAYTSLLVIPVWLIEF